MSTQHLAIVVYRASVDGVPMGSLDFQVRWFRDGNVEQIQRHLMAESPDCYANDADEEVSWTLAEVLAIEPFEPRESGEEVVGFIASAEELSGLSS